MAEVGWEKQLKTAMRQLRKEKIGARLNIMECCRGCVTDEKLGIKEGQPVVWHYGGQGSRVLFDVNGIPFVEDNDWNRARGKGDVYEPEHILFNHCDDAGPRAAIVFQQHGLTVDWDGSDSKCIAVIGPSKKEVEFLRCQGEAYRMHEYWLRDQATKRARVERLRREADELEATLA